MAQEQEMVYIVYKTRPNDKPLPYRKDYWEDPERQKYLGKFKLCKDTDQIKKYYGDVLVPVKKTKKKAAENNTGNSEVKPETEKDTDKKK